MSPRLIAAIESAASLAVQSWGNEVDSATDKEARRVARLEQRRAGAVLTYLNQYAAWQRERAAAREERRRRAKEDDGWPSPEQDDELSF